MSDEKMDLSILDPSRDQERWKAIVDSLASRAWNTRRRQLSVSFQIVCWARPALAIAASLALVSWAATWARDGTARCAACVDGATTSSTSSRSAQDPTTQLAQWAAADQMPATMQILQVLGTRHGD